MPKTLLVRPDFSGSWLLAIVADGELVKAATMKHTPDYFDRLSAYVADESPNTVLIDVAANGAELAKRAIATMRVETELVDFAHIGDQAALARAKQIAEPLAAGDDADAVMEVPGSWRPLAPNFAVEDASFGPPKRPGEGAAAAGATPAPTAPTNGRLEQVLRRVAGQHIEELAALCGAAPERASAEELVLWVISNPERGEEVLAEGFPGVLLRRAALAEPSVLEDDDGRPVAELSETEIALRMAELQGAGRLGPAGGRALAAYRKAQRRTRAKP